MKRVALSMIVFLAVLFSACAIPPTDLSGIRVGATRATVEGVLGKPVKSMQTDSGKIDTYKYNRGDTPTRGSGGGHPVQPIDDPHVAVGALIFLAVVAPIAYDIRFKRQREDIEVTYDSEDTVVRVDPTQVALLLTEGCEGKTPRKPDIGGPTSSGLALETLYLSWINPLSGGCQFRWGDAVLVVKTVPGLYTTPRCHTPRVEFSPSGGRLAQVLG